MNLESRPLGKERIAYIDAMRGFSMLLVVLAHMMKAMGLPGDETFIGVMLMTFRMPLFFFVSGFFAFRPLERWTARFATTTLKRKIQAQVICTLCFFMLYQAVNGEPPFAFLHQGFKWFWFTIVLFQMFLAYFILALGERAIGKRIFVVPGLIILSVYSITYHITHQGGMTGILETLGWCRLTEYFIFFSAGILSRRYYTVTEKALKSNLWRTLSLLVYIGSLIFLFSYGHLAWQIAPWGVGYVVQFIVVRFAGLFCVFVLFFHSRAYFDGESRASRWMKFVGKRTLDIYMIHPFLLPNLVFLAPFFRAPQQVLLLILAAGVLSVACVGVCLLLSNLLRTSPFLAEWLFGSRTSGTHRSDAPLFP